MIYAGMDFQNVKEYFAANPADFVSSKKTLEIWLTVKKRYFCRHVKLPLTKD